MFLTETSCFYGSFWDTQFSIPSVSASNHLKFLNPLTISADISANLSLCEINNHEAKPETEMEIPPVLDGIAAVVGQHVLFPSPIYRSCVGSDCSDGGCVVVSEKIEEGEGERTQHKERGRRPVEIKYRRKDKAGGDQAAAPRPPPHRQTSFPTKTSPNFSFRVVKAVGQYSVLMGLSVGNLIARWDEMGLPLYPILGMFGADRFDAVLLPG